MGDSCCSGSSPKISTWPSASGSKGSAFMSWLSQPVTAQKRQMASRIPAATQSAVPAKRQLQERSQSGIVDLCGGRQLPQVQGSKKSLPRTAPHKATASKPQEKTKNTSFWTVNGKRQRPKTKEKKPTGGPGRERGSPRRPVGGAPRGVASEGPAPARRPRGSRGSGGGSGIVGLGQLLPLQLTVPLPLTIPGLWILLGLEKEGDLDLDAASPSAWPLLPPIPPALHRTTVSDRPTSSLVEINSRLSPRRKLRHGGPLAETPRPPRNALPPFGPSNSSSDIPSLPPSLTPLTQDPCLH
ncbi:unnamed protein product [Nyctereutes procyonoides]|uniref:(raccoon dog) hypothetical protein n=1 Tax=Nyctereutes procyonoides TaxID=34880 RepID=A0A811XXJ0_NYCPR|nr:unnamed protein product [Nyctereutes procyonoides]